MRVVPQSQAVPMLRARATNYSGSGYPSRSDTTTIPTSNDGVCDFSAQPPLNFKIIPFGQSTSGQTFSMRVIGWMKALCLPLPQYYPVDLWEGTVTLGTSPGIGSAVAASTIASSSNGVALPTGVINLASTTGFTTSGTVLIATSAGVQKVAYTGISGNSLVGCNLNVRELMGTGTMSTGAPVVQLNGAGNAVTSADLFAASVSGTVGNANIDYIQTSPGGPQIAHIVVQSKGCSFIETLFNLGTATNANALVGAL